MSPWKLFGRLLREKRGYYSGIRETAKTIGVSPATLSRAERGGVPTIDSFAKLYSWLKPEESVGYFVGIFATKN